MFGQYCSNFFSEHLFKEEVISVKTGMNEAIWAAEIGNFLEVGILNPILNIVCTSE
jgi:hypothetical protein